MPPMPMPPQGPMQPPMGGPPMGGMMPGAGVMNPISPFANDGSSDQPTCPCCGQPMPMPFNMPGGPQQMIPQQQLGVPGPGVGGSPYESSLLSAIMGGGDGSGGMGDYQ